MTGMQFLLAFVSFWTGSGLAAWVYFHYWLNKTYKDVPDVGTKDWVVFELFIALLAGPINWLAIAVIIDTHNKDKDDEDDMEV